MKQSFALTLIICAYLAPVFLWPDAVNTAAGAEPDTPPAAAQQQAAGKQAQPRSPLFEALEIRASEDAARQIAGTGEAAHRGPGTAWDQGTRLCRDGTAARRDRDVGRPARRTAGTASVEPRADQDRQGVGRFAAAPLPGDAARRLVPVAAGNLRRGRPAQRRRGRQCPPPIHAAENTPPNESGNGPIKDELQ